MQATWKYEKQQQEVLVTYMKRAQQIFLHTMDKSEKLFTINMRESFISVESIHITGKLRVLFREGHHSLKFRDVRSAEQFLAEYQAAFYADRYEKQLADSKAFDFPTSDEEMEESQHERTSSIVYQPAAEKPSCSASQLANEYAYHDNRSQSASPETGTGAQNTSVASDSAFADSANASAQLAQEVGQSYAFARNQENSLAYQFSKTVFQQAPYILGVFDGYQNAFLFQCTETSGELLPVLMPFAPHGQQLILNPGSVYIVAELFKDLESNSTAFTAYVLGNSELIYFKKAIFVCSQAPNCRPEAKGVYPLSEAGPGSFGIITSPLGEPNQQFSQRFGGVSFAAENSYPRELSRASDAVCGNESAMWAHFCKYYTVVTETPFRATTDYRDYWGQIGAVAYKSVGKTPNLRCFFNDGKSICILDPAITVLARLRQVWASNATQGGCKAAFQSKEEQQAHTSERSEQRNGYYQCHSSSADDSLRYGQYIFICSSKVLPLYLQAPAPNALSNSQKALQIRFLAYLKVEKPNIVCVFQEDARDIELDEANASAEAKNCNAINYVRDLAVIKVSEEASGRIATTTIYESGGCALRGLAQDACYFVICKPLDTALCLLMYKDYSLKKSQTSAWAREYAARNGFSALYFQQLRCDELAWFSDGFTFTSAAPKPKSLKKQAVELKYVDFAEYTHAVFKRSDFQLKYSVATDYDGNSHDAHALEFTAKRLVVTHLTSGCAHMFNYKRSDAGAGAQQAAGKRGFGTHYYEVFVWQGAHALSRQNMLQIGQLHFTQADCEIHAEKQFDESYEFLAMRDVVVYSIGSYWANLRGCWKVLATAAFQDRSELRIFKASLHRNKRDVVMLQEILCFGKTVYYVPDDAVLFIDYVAQKIVTHYGSCCCAFLERRLEKIAKVLFSSETAGFKVRRYADCLKKYKATLKLKELGSDESNEQESDPAGQQAASSAPAASSVDDPSKTDTEVSSKVAAGQDDESAAMTRSTTVLYKIIPSAQVLRLFEVQTYELESNFDYFVRGTNFRYLVTYQQKSLVKKCQKAIGDNVEVINLQRTRKMPVFLAKLQAIFPACFGLRLSFIDELRRIPRASFLTSCAVYGLTCRMMEFQQRRNEEYAEGAFYEYYELQNRLLRDYCGDSSRKCQKASNFITEYIAYYGSSMERRAQKAGERGQAQAESGTPRAQDAQHDEDDVRFADMIIPIVPMIDDSDDDER